MLSKSTILALIKIICALTAMLMSVSAQASVSVVGTVTDQNGDVIKGARVEALSLTNGQNIVTRTDAAGKYELSGLSSGTYRITVGGEGFATVSRNIQTPTNGTLTADFLLVPGVIENTVNVTAGKGNARLTVETPQTITVTDTLEIEARRPASTMQAIEKAPNLTTIGANPAATRPRLRGLASNRVLVIVDGERLNNMRSDPLSGVSLSVIDVTQVDSAEVASGAESSLYGSDALAGTINLLTKSPSLYGDGKHLGLRFDGDAQSNGAFRRGAATLNLSSQRFALRLSGSLFRLGNYHAGGESISLDEVVRVGRFANELGNAINGNIARTYAVWSLPAGAEITNGQGHGFNSQTDFWFFPSTTQSIRYRQLNSQHKNIGFAFITPPFDLRNQFNGFRRLDKYGLRYEGRELRSWLARVSFGFYRQKYSIPDDTITSTINLGSSWTITPPATQPILTGNASRFTPTNFTDGKNSVTTVGAEAQATFVPFRKLTLTSGVGYLRDSSVDKFLRFDFTPVTLQPRNIVGGRATTPDSAYRNLSWFNLVEYEPLRWLRLTGGLRVDNWQTRARVTSGFPLSTETAILNASFNRLTASPGAININGASGIIPLINGASGLKTSKTSVTGNVGLVLRLPGRVNPYFRWGTSYREPGVTERYILRDFGDPTFSVLLIPNTALKPERGSNYEFGVKIERERVLASVGYFRNNLKDFIRNEFSSTFFVPADPAHGLEPISPFFPFHGVLYVQRGNTARARIQGVEAAFEIALRLGRAGSITPYGTLGWLKGSDLTPDENTLTLIRQFYNREDTPLRLRGSVSDAPLSNISPFGSTFGARYADRKGVWLGLYEIRAQARTTRVAPLDLATAISTQYGSFASLSPFMKHSLRAVYNYRRERYRTSLTFGVDNLTNKLYFEPFQTAPAPGRSVVFGVTFDFFDLLQR
ncbi:MAG: TonB-dependent receptor [Acidobacteria bacterium]|nr:TonB-dependent receptor [Acidobacteriota bacterium]